MRVGLDAHMVGSHETGNETYVLGLIKGLEQLKDSVDLFVYHAGSFGGDGLRWIHARRLGSPSPWSRLTLDLPLRTWRDRLDVVHMSYTAPVWSTCPIVLAVHDVSYLTHPEWFSSRDLNVLSRAVPWSIRRATRVITISDRSRRDIIERYDVPEEKVVRIYLAAGPAGLQVDEATARAQVAAYGIDSDRPYILAVGNLQPRKNLVRLITAFRSLREDGVDVDLVLTGPLHFRSELVTSAAADLGRNVLFTGYVGHQQLASLYSRATIFAFPSLYEGFGIPALEAMAHGTPVACARAGALPEVCGDAAVYFEPRDTESIAAALKRLLDDPGLREELSRAGRERESRFTWTRAARETVDVYREAVQRDSIRHTTN